MNYKTSRRKLRTNTSAILLPDRISQTLPINTKLRPTLSAGHTDTHSQRSLKQLAGVCREDRSSAESRRCQKKSKIKAHVSVVTAHTKTRIAQPSWKLSNHILRNGIVLYPKRQFNIIWMPPYQLPCAHSVPSARRFFHTGRSSCLWLSIGCGVPCLTPYCHGSWVFRAGCLHWGWSKHEESI